MLPQPSRSDASSTVEPGSASSEPPASSCTFAVSAVSAPPPRCGRTLLRILGERIVTPESEAFAAVASGEGRTVVVERPVESLAARAADAGLHVLHARARPESAPFALAVDLLRPAVERLPARARTRVFAGTPGLVEPLFESRPAAAGELALVHGLYWLTARLAERAPLALLVENARHADEPSLRLCAYLAQRIDELPVALVLA